MKTIAFFNVKGGVGKTTSTVNVAYNLADVYNKRVLVIDLDPQANTSDFFDDGHYKDAHSIEDVFNGTCCIKEAIYKTRFKNVDIVPATITLCRTEKLMVSNTIEPQQMKLSAQLELLENEYDYVVIDCSPAAETLTNINGLAAANMIFVPLKSDKWALKGLNYTLSIVKTVKKFSSKLDFGGAFFVQQERRIVNNVANKLVLDFLGSENLLLPAISKNKAAEESGYRQEPVAKCDARSNIAKDYRALTEQIVLRLSK